MTALLSIWAPEERKWMAYAILPNEEDAKTRGRQLWKQGCPGIKIEVTTTTVEEIRK